jgi:hypothetical protein
MLSAKLIYANISAPLLMVELTDSRDAEIAININ